MKKQGFIILLVVVAAVALMALAVQQRARFPMVSALVTSVLTPLNQGVLAVNTGISDWRQDHRSREALAEENAHLKAQLANLQSAEFRIAGLQAENDALRKLAGYKESHPVEQLLAARVVGVNVGELHDGYLLNKGAQDGVQENMCVVTHAGLVGVIDEVYPTTSSLLLLSSARMRMGTRVVRAASRTVGVLTGTGVAGAHLRMEYLPREADIAAGDLIVTSGVGGRYLPNIFIGTVAKVELDAAGLLKRALVRPGASSTSLEMVYIITGVTGAEDLPAALTTADPKISQELTRSAAPDAGAGGSSYTDENAPLTPAEEARLEAERAAQRERARADERDAPVVQPGGLTERQDAGQLAPPAQQGPAGREPAGGEPAGNAQGAAPGGSQGASPAPAGTGTAAPAAEAVKKPAPAAAAPKVSPKATTAAPKKPAVTPQAPATSAPAGKKPSGQGAKP